MDRRKRIAYVRYEGRRMMIMAPYDTAFIAELKSTLKFRQWNQEKKVWEVDIGERQKALELTKRFFPVVEDNKPPEIPQSLLEELKKASSQTDITTEWLAGGNLEIWIDGACVGNPGPGGYGIVFGCRGQRKIKSGGFRLTTNNRMEIMAAIVALEPLKEKSNVVIYSDSQYLVDVIMKGWAKRWKSNNWKRNKKEKALNPDYGTDYCSYPTSTMSSLGGSGGTAFKRKTSGVISWRRRLLANPIFPLTLVMNATITLSYRKDKPIYADGELTNVRGV